MFEKPANQVEKRMIIGRNRMRNKVGVEYLSVSKGTWCWEIVIAIEFVGLLIKHELYYFFHFGLPAQSIAMSIAFCLEIVTGISATERLR